MTLFALGCARAICETSHLTNRNVKYLVAAMSTRGESGDNEGVQVLAS